MPDDFFNGLGYDPSQGRFLSEDPLGIMAGPNLYSYVYDYPIGLGDPSGQQAGAAPALASAPGTIGVVVVGGLVIGWVAGRGIGHIPIGSGRTVDNAVQD